MKGEHWRTGALSLALGMTAAIGCSGCLATAFELEVRNPRLLAAVWLVLGIVSTGLYFRKWGAKAILGLSGLALWFLCRSGLPMEQAEHMAATIGQIYRSAYYGAAPPAGTCTADWPLGILGGLIMLSVGYSICRRRKRWLAGSLLGTSLWCCLIVTDTVPKAAYLFALLTAMLLLAFAASQEAGEQQNRLAFRAIAPILLLLVVLFRLFPQGSYANPQFPIRDWAMEYAEQHLSLGRLAGMQLPQMDLRRTANREQQSQPILELTSTAGGTVYLRSQSYCIYTGTGWQAEQTQEAFGGTGEALDTLFIHTAAPMEMQLLPYYPAPGTLLTGGMAENREGLTQYTVQVFSSAECPLPGETMLQLPRETLRRGTALLEPLDIRSTEAAVQSVWKLVSGSARYDLDTPAMPEEETDFALWFLEASETGYCVHFATAAAVLLRCAGIPARYVTGFRAETLPGEPTAVTTDDAHAWVEYYAYSDSRWHILEATPTLELPEAIPEDTAPTVSEEHSPDSRPSLLWLAVLPGVWVVLLLQRQLRIRLRHRRCTHGCPNQQALARYAECRTLARLLEQPLPEELDALAEKARYSPHQLSPRELEAFSAYRRTARRQLTKSRSIRVRVLKYVRGI